jgi:hypothetical protein
MLQDLSKGPWKVSEILLFECDGAFVAPEVERGQKGVLGQGSKQESLAVVGTRRHECYQGIEQQKVKRREHRSIVALSKRNHCVWDG